MKNENVEPPIMWMKQSLHRPPRMWIDPEQTWSSINCDLLGLISMVQARVLAICFTEHNLLWKVTVWTWVIATRPCAVIGRKINIMVRFDSRKSGFLLHDSMPHFLCYITQAGVVTSAKRTCGHDLFQNMVVLHIYHVLVYINSRTITWSTHNNYFTIKIGN